MNPLYQQMMGIGGAMGQPMAPQPLNPMQQIQAVMNAMRNPAAFLKQKFPDIPDEIINDPNRVLSYLQQTRGISNQDIQRVQAQIMQGGNPWQQGR